MGEQCTLVKQESVESANSNDLGMAVVEYNSFGVWYFRFGKAFHASPSSAFQLQFSKVAIEIYPRATHVKGNLS